MNIVKMHLKGEETSNFEFPLITRNGVRIEVLLNATTRKDEQGAVIGVVGIGQDVCLCIFILQKNLSELKCIFICPTFCLVDYRSYSSRKGVF